MVEKEIIVIDDKEYFVLNELTYEKTNYVYLVSEKDLKDFLIMKSVFEREEEYLVNLDNEEEFDILFTLFQKELKENKK